MYIYLEIKITHVKRDLKLKKRLILPFIAVNPTLDQWMSTLTNQCWHGI